MSSIAITRVKPPALKNGATLAVVSPASAARSDAVHAGIERLHELGYRTVLMQHALTRGPLYYAGTAEQRAADLMSAFANPRIDGIVCTRGGWGSAELLPHLDADIIRANPKVFAGYSDHTSLHIWLASQAGLTTFHAPMVAADFARPNGIDASSWRYAMGGAATWSLAGVDGLRVLRRGKAEGLLTGGCLAILAESLGTPYALQPASADEPRVLFLEDIGTKPYQWDRMLLHLRYAGQLAYVSGIVFGEMRQCVATTDEPLLERVILHALAGFAGPIAIGLRSGHVEARNITLPFGVQVRLDLSKEDNPRLEFLEAAVGVG